MPRSATDAHVSRRTLLWIGGGAVAAGALGATPKVGAQPARTVGVVGAGVVGLNVARVFAEHGYTVTIYAASVSPGTTSDVAAAVIFPHLVPPTPQILEAIRLTNAYYASLVSAGVG